MPKPFRATSTSGFGAWEPFGGPIATTGFPGSNAEVLGERGCEGLNIGGDGGAPVTDVTVDVSGEPYVHLEKEALAMMKRD